METLAKFSNWKTLLPLFLIFALFSFYIFPQYQYRMTEAANGPVAPLDTRFSYTVEEARGAFDKLGAAGREVYREVVSRVDMVYPIVYGLLFMLVLAWILKKLTTSSSSWLFLALLPLVGVTFDYLENINTRKLLAQYPNLSTASVSWGERMTQFKHIAGLLSVALAVILFIVVMIRKVTHKPATR